MLASLRNLLAPSGPARREQPSEQLAVALLLLELARADFDFAEVEQQRVRELLAQRYTLGAEQVEQLMQQAHGAGSAAVSLFDYVRTLNARLQPQDKYPLMEMLWQVAYADGRLDPHEEHLLRKLAGLLYVPEADFIRAKLYAAEHAPKPQAP